MYPECFLSGIPSVYVTRGDTNHRGISLNAAFFTRVPFTLKTGFTISRTSARTNQSQSEEVLQTQPYPAKSGNKGEAISGFPKHILFYISHTAATMLAMTPLFGSHF
uniref:Uncharacterized protein n=1 Tax=Glossina austeni TaxID=7395 RepID=A0A1A9UD81_GLOAU